MAVGRCAECKDCYGNNCIPCTICAATPFEVCDHCPPSMMHGG